MNRQKIQVFNGGVCKLYRIGKGEKLSLILENIRFEDRTVGMERFFKARDYQQNATRMIRIPRIPELRANDVIVIEAAQYNIIQCQKIFDTFPKCWQLTLEEIKGVNQYDL